MVGSLWSVSEKCIDDMHLISSIHRFDKGICIGIGVGIGIGIGICIGIGVGIGIGIGIGIG